MVVYFLMIFSTVLLQVNISSASDTQQQYQLHNNFARYGKSGYVYDSDKSNIHRSSPNARRIQEPVHVIPPEQEAQHMMQPNPRMVQEQQIPRQQIPNNNDSYTGYPHYDSNAKLKRFALQNVNFKKYYALNFGSTLIGQYKYSQGNTSSLITNSNIVPIINQQGLGGLYFGHKIPSASGVFFRLEYGGQWEVLSFTDETPQYKRSIHQHNIAGSFRGFADVPISRRFDITVGFDLNYGLLSNIIAQDQVFTTGLSYGMMAGSVMKISRSRSLFFLLRYGTIANQDYKILNTTRPSSFSSTSVIVGIQIASW